MKTEIKIEKKTYDYIFPIQEPPPWANQVERWNQMDAYAYGLVQSYFTLMKPAGLKPDLIFLGSPEASNRSDLLFAKTGANSPSRFVHTLPNSRGSGLLQVMKWTGPLLCIQNDPDTLETAITEAKELVEGGPWKRIWVLGVNLASNTHSTDERSSCGFRYKADWISVASETLEEFS